MTKVGLYAIGKSTTLESNKSQTPLIQGHGFTRMSIAFMPACVLGDMTIRASTTAGASTPEMKMATAFVKSM